jgi:hypothetical protein
VEEFEPNPEDIKMYKELEKNNEGAGIKELTEEIEKNLANMDLDKYDEEDGDLIFTTELNMLKPKEQRDQEMEDEDD